MSCCGLIPFVTIETGTIGMVTSCGKHSKALRAGFSFLNPCCLEQVRGIVNLRQRELKIMLETKTKDNVFISVTMSVMYTVIVEKVYEAFYILSDPEKQMTAYVYDCVRSALCDLTLDETFNNKDKIAQSVKTNLSAKMNAFGYQIITTLVSDIDPDKSVKNAMNEINASARLKEAAVQKAEGEKVLKVKQAESQMEAQYLSGVGVANQRKAIMEGLRQNVVGFSTENIGSYKDIMDLLVLTQYFDVLSEIGTKANTRVIFTGEDHSSQQGFMSAMAGN